MGRIAITLALLTTAAWTQAPTYPTGTTGTQPFLADHAARAVWRRPGGAC